MCGSNGRSKAAAFTSPELENLDEIIIPLSMLSPIISF